MGIELPPELASVAAKVGVSWPQADEDKMRQSATAWRDAGTRLTHLTKDADHTARTALNAVHGDTGDAARKHWSTFVQPDTGHLTGAAKGCHAAADRLDHGANQVGAAKVEIIRHLVDLAKNTDAANHAAAAGHPNAVLGLPTLVHGTAANVSNVTNSLVTSVVPGSGLDVATTPALVDAHPGAHPTHAAPAGLLNQVLGTGSGPGQGVVPGLVDHVVGVAQPVLDSTPNLVQGTANAAPVVLHGATDAVSGVAQGATDAVPGATDAVRGAVPVPDPGHAGADLPPGHPDITGPVHIPTGGGPAHAGLPVDLPTPPTGQPPAIGHTVQAGFAGGIAPSAGVLDPSAGAALPPVPPAGSASGGGGFAGGGPGFAVGGPGFAGGGPVAGPAPGSIAGPAPGPVSGGAGPAPVAAGPPAAGVAPVSDAPRERGRMTTTVPPAQPAPVTQSMAAAAPARDKHEPAVLFWVHMFPIGHMPVVSDRPVRQLPPPPAELDYAPGMRFEPGDHPEHHRVDPAPRLAELRAGVPPLEPTPGLPADDSQVVALTEGHDPLGGQHEREWDRRFLVRLGSVTAEGISDEGKEYAWPPGEWYPEGGTAPGEPEMLPEGAEIDRFGSPSGRVFSLDTTLFAQRSLPPEALAAGYYRYRVLRPLPVWRTVSAPWFGQPGGGERYRTTYSAMELVALGYLAEQAGGQP
jgi:hypothetical protein